jgi:hypothetical protein
MTIGGEDMRCRVSRYARTVRVPAITARTERVALLRSVADAVLQTLMPAGMERLFGTGRHERNSDRLNDGTASMVGHWIGGGLRARRPQITRDWQVSGSIPLTSATASGSGG